MFECPCGSGKEHVAKGLCDSCYKRQWRESRPEHAQKAAEYARSRYKANPEKHREYARSARRKDPEKHRAANKAWRSRNPERWRHDRLLREYGITQEAYLQMVEAQGGKCLVCDEAPTKKKLAVDHCHDTGKVRGLLCVTCNRALGLLKDSPQRLERAFKYLAAAQEQGSK